MGRSPIIAGAEVSLGGLSLLELERVGGLYRVQTTRSRRIVMRSSGGRESSIR